jgi:hypothetical protein
MLFRAVSFFLVLLSAWPLSAAPNDPRAVSDALAWAGSGDFHEKAVKGKFIGTWFFSRNPTRWQGGKGSRFHPNSRLSAVHGWIRCP